MLQDFCHLNNPQFTSLTLNAWNAWNFYFKSYCRYVFLYLVIMSNKTLKWFKWFMLFNIVLNSRCLSCFTSYILFVISKKRKIRDKQWRQGKAQKRGNSQRKEKNQSCADFHDESITFLQGNISQYTRKLYEMKSSLSEGTK